MCLVCKRHMLLLQWSDEHLALLLHAPKLQSGLLHITAVRSTFIIFGTLRLNLLRLAVTTFRCRSQYNRELIRTPNIVLVILDVPLWAIFLRRATLRHPNKIIIGDTPCYAGPTNLCSSSDGMVTNVNKCKTQLEFENQVLLSHFKARQPIRNKTSTATDTRGGALAAAAANNNKRTASAASNYDRIRQSLISARARHGVVGENSATHTTPSYVGLLASYQKGAPREENANPRSPSSSRPLVEKGWRDFQVDNSEGMLYQTRVGLSRNW